MKIVDKEQRTKNTTSDILESVVVESVEDSITLFEIKSILHEKGFAILMMLFALPLSIPLPTPPGYTTLLALPLLVFSVQIILGHDSPWLPNFIGKKSIKRKTLAFFIEKTVPWLRKIERFSKRRFPIFNNPIGEKIYGIICLVCAISIAIPLPLTNFIPAGGIAIMSLGLLNRDGLISFLGILVAALGLFIASLVIFLGQEVVVKIFSFFR